MDYDIALAFDGERDGAKVWEFRLTPKAERRRGLGPDPDAGAPGRPHAGLRDATTTTPASSRARSPSPTTGRWAAASVPATLTVTPADKPDEHTTLTYHDLEFDVGLTPGFFSLQNLKRPVSARRPGALVADRRPQPGAQSEAHRARRRRAGLRLRGGGGHGRALRRHHRRPGRQRHALARRTDPDPRARLPAGAPHLGDDRRRHWRRSSSRVCWPRSIREPGVTGRRAARVRRRPDQRRRAHGGRAAPGRRPGAGAARERPACARSSGAASPSSGTHDVAPRRRDGAAAARAGGRHDRRRRAGRRRFARQRPVRGERRSTTPGSRPSTPAWPCCRSTRCSRCSRSRRTAFTRSPSTCATRGAPRAAADSHRRAAGRRAPARGHRGAVDDVPPRARVVRQPRQGSTNGFFIAIVFLMAIFGVTNTLLMSTFERRREFAVEQALGVDASDARAHDRLRGHRARRGFAGGGCGRSRRRCSTGGTSRRSTSAASSAT